MNMLGAWFTSTGIGTVQKSDEHSSPPLAETFNIEAQGIQKGEKVGANGLEPSTSRM